MVKKPDQKTAMLALIRKVRAEFPFDEPDADICGDTCIGCPKKLLEIVETEILHWQCQIDQGALPSLGEISRFAKLCKNVKRGLIRNGILS